jgi:hypothetical protein
MTDEPPSDAPSDQVNLMTVSEVVVGSFVKLTGESGTS